MKINSGVNINVKVPVQPEADLSYYQEGEINKPARHKQSTKTKSILKKVVQWSAEEIKCLVWILAP